MLGIALEYGQLYSGWRDFEVADMAADAVGVACGLIVGVAVRSMALSHRIMKRQG